MTAILTSPFPYGASELQRAARPNLARALTVGSALGSMAFALAWMLTALVPAAHPRGVARVVPLYDLYDVLRPLPPALNPVAPRPAPAPAVRAAAAIPVPVEDVAANTAQTIADQQTLATGTGPATAETAQPMPGTEPFQDGPVNERGTVALVDQLPVPVFRVSPSYPPMAHQAGVGGVVQVDILVGRDGRVLEARLHPTRQELLLNAAALEAARQWRFDPALVAGRAVAVWVTIPFRFTLHER